MELLRQQVHIPLTLADIKYIADFEVRDKKTGQIFYIEYKGFETDVWKIKKRLYAFYGPARLDIYKKVRNKIVLVETLLPKLNDL